MYPDAPTLNGQLRRIAEVFYATLAPEACKRRVGLYALAILVRVQRFERRFCALYALWKAGRLPKVRVRAVTAPPVHAVAPPPRADCAVAPPPPLPSPVKGEGEEREAFDPMAPGGASWVTARLRPASVLPRAFAWLPKMLPWSGGTLLGGVESLLLNFPEMRAFAAECPQVRRILRPICTMAGLKAPDYLALPRRRGGRAVAAPPPDGAVAPPPPRPSPVEGEGEKRRRRTPREVAAAAMERARRTGKPIDPRRIGAVAFGYVLHWPRDGNCPPPEIGYGGRTFTPLPKDYVRPKE